MPPIKWTTFKLITVEPVILLYNISMAMSNLGAQNLLLQKVCHPGPNMPAPGAHCDYEGESQRQVADIGSWKHVLQLSFPVLFVMFAGPWSDSHGKRRKPLIYIPLCGQILMDILCIVNVYFWEWSVITAALSEVVLQSLTGWRPCFLLGTTSYITDISSPESRTTRIGMSTALIFIGLPLGDMLFGVIFKNFGFYGVFTAPVVMNLIAFVYLVKFVDNSCCINEDDTTQKDMCEGLIDPAGLLESLRIVFKPRKSYRRAIIMLVLIAAPIVVAPVIGESAVFYFYMRIKFDWDVIDYGFYAAYKTMVISFGVLVSMGLLSHLLAVPDAVIGILASITMMAAAFGYAFTTAVWQLFVWPLVDFMHGAALAVIPSIASKNVEESEIGRVNAAIRVTDAIFPLFNMPLYYQVYKHTVNQMPGAIFFISILYAVISLVIFSVMYILQRKQKSQENVGQQWEITHL